MAEAGTILMALTMIYKKNAVELASYYTTYAEVEVLLRKIFEKIKARRR